MSPEVVEKQHQGEYFVPITERSALDPMAPEITKEMQEKLWKVSERLTGCTFEV